MQTVITTRHILQVNSHVAGRCLPLIPLLQLNLTSAMNLDCICIMSFNSVVTSGYTKHQHQTPPPTFNSGTEGGLGTVPQLTQQCRVKHWYLKPQFLSKYNLALLVAFVVPLPELPSLVFT